MIKDVLKTTAIVHLLRIVMLQRLMGVESGSSMEPHSTAFRRCVKVLVCACECVIMNSLEGCGLGWSSNNGIGWEALGQNHWCHISAVPYLSYLSDALAERASKRESAREHGSSSVK